MLAADDSFSSFRDAARADLWADDRRGDGCGVLRAARGLCTAGAGGEGHVHGGDVCRGAGALRDRGREAVPRAGDAARTAGRSVGAVVQPVWAGLVRWADRRIRGVLVAGAAVQ